MLYLRVFMMNWFRLPTFALSALLQFAPLMRVAVAESTVAVSPMVAVIRWLTGAAAVAGTFHGVSGATGLTITAGGAKVTTPTSTNGIPIPGFRMSIISSFYGAAAAYRFSNLPPGLAGSLQGVITGTPSQTGQFTVLVTGYEHSNASGNTFQTSFNVSVVDQAPNVVTPPSSQTVVAGTSVSFKVTATGTGLQYRWLKDDIELAAPAGIAAAYSIVSAKTTDAGHYKVRISNTGGVVVSAEAILTVTQPGPTLVAGPLDSNVHEGEALILTVLATSTAPLTFQWLKDGKPIDGGTTTTMSIGSVKSTDAGNYSVLVTAGGSSIPAGPAVVKVNPPPVLTLGPSAGDGTRTLTASTIAGRSYVLEDRPTLDVGTWSTVAPVVATGSSSALTAPGSPTATHFWRLRVVPLVQ